MGKHMLPRERTKYKTPVEQPHIDKTTPCRMDDCTLFHALEDDLPGKFTNVLNVNHIRSTDHGFTFRFDKDGKSYKATAIYGTQTGKRIHRLDETYLKTRSISRARATMRPFTAEWWIESISLVVRKPMSDADKKRLRRIRADQQAGIKEPQGGKGRNRRRGFSLAA